MLTANELQVFLTAAETENFSEAGRRLGVTQPAVSMQIRGLEKRLGITLFDRVGRHVKLSEAGQALVPMARDLVDRSINIEESMASLHGEVVGVLRIGCSTAAGKYVLPRILAGLRARHSRVEVVCHVTGRHAALQLLKDGEVQVALTSLREPIKGIEYRPFLTDHIVLITPPEHPWAKRRAAVTPAELTEETFILREDGSGTMEAIREGLAWHDMTVGHLDRAMTLGNSEAIRMAVAEGIGVSFVSLMVADEAARAGRVAIVDVADLALSRTLHMAHDVDRPATRAQAAFWEFAFSPESDAVRRLPDLAD